MFQYFTVGFSTRCAPSCSSETFFCDCSDISERKAEELCYRNLTTDFCTHPYMIRGIVSGIQWSTVHYSQVQYDVRFVKYRILLTATKYCLCLMTRMCQLVGAVRLYNIFSGKSVTVGGPLYYFNFCLCSAWWPIRLPTGIHVSTKSERHPKTYG